MAKTTEAACLLQSGSMYGRRVGLRDGSGRITFAGVKAGAVSLYFDDEPIYHFDLDGRWQRAFAEGVHYLKGLDASVRSIDRERERGGMVLHRRNLEFARSVDLDDSIRSVALGLIGDLYSGRLEILPPPSTARLFEVDDLREFLERVAGWDSSAWFAHRERYLATYGPIPILPPDCPNALVLQATLGHENGRAFGRGRPAEHHARSPEEFREHLHDVRRLVGRRVEQFKGIFLGGADLLHRTVEDLLGHLDAVGRAFEVGEGPGRIGLVHAFLDDFRPPLPDLGGWDKLRASGLGRVTLGVESGDPEVRSFYGKTWPEDDLRAVIEDLRAAGIGIGLVVLVGAGGRSSAGRHFGATVDLLEGLPLVPKDLVSLIDARGLDESPVDPLSDEEIAGQVAGLKARSAARPSKGPKLVAYNPDKQWT